MSGELKSCTVPGHYIPFLTETFFYKESGGQLEVYEKIGSIKKMFIDLGAMLKICKKNYDKIELGNKTFYAIKRADPKVAEAVKKVLETKKPVQLEENKKSTKQLKKETDSLKKNIEALRDTKWIKIEGAETVTAFGEREDVYALFSFSVTLQKDQVLDEKKLTELKPQVNQLKKELKETVEKLTVDDNAQKLHDERVSILDLEEKTDKEYLSKVNGWLNDVNVLKLQKTSLKEINFRKELKKNIPEGVPAYLLTKEAELTEVQKHELRVFNELKEAKEANLARISKKRSDIENELQANQKKREEAIKALKQSVYQKIKESDPDIWKDIS